MQSGLLLHAYQKGDGMKNARCTRNQKTREYLTEIIKSAKPGSILFTNELSIALSTKYRSVNNRNVGNALRERDDVELINLGTWRVK